LSAKAAILILLGGLSAVFAALWARELRRARAGRPTLAQLAIGALTNFFDTLGVGSFATTTALYRLGRMVPDELIPGTMNVGHALPTVAQAFIFVATVQVEPTTLAAMIAAAVTGAWLGAGVVAKWSRRRIQLGMGALLVVAAGIMIARLTSAMPDYGDALGLTGPRLAIGIAGNFALGALMTLGIGLYAPCMILVSLLGMSELAAFPIMMGSCAFLAPLAGLRFAWSGRTDARAAIGLTVGGVPAVLVAGLLVRSLPLAAVKWLVVVVVVYTAVVMLRAARRAS
jgi:uncharacterized membrane protein YfcA